MAEEQKKIAIIGDLHFYDGSCKSHNDYFANSRDVMDRYTAEFRTTKPDYIIIAGDLIGFSERVTRTRFGLSVFISYLKIWNELTNNNVYSVRGNHDFSKDGSLADFDLLQMIGLIKNVESLDVYSLRMHLIDYGSENREISLDTNKHNIAVMHASLIVDGLTTWFHANDSINLSMLNNLKGVEMVLCGHVHNPSPKLVSTSIEDSNISLLYLGSASRARRNEIWNNVYVAYLTCSPEGATSIATNILALRPTSEIFTQKALDAEDEEADITENTATVDIELLTQILDELSPSLMGTELDYRTQIRRFAGVDTAAAELAISYLDKADESLKVS